MRRERHSPVRAVAGSRHEVVPRGRGWAYGGLGMTDPVPAENCVAHAWREHQDELHAFLRRRLHDPEAASDLLQVVFLRALHQGRHFCELEAPRAWLFRVARNALTDHLRTRRPMLDLPADLAQPDRAQAPVESLSECLPYALASLSAADRDVLESCELGAMTQRAFADSRGLSLAAAKSRALRARARLREAMVRNCGVRFDVESGKVCCYVPRSQPPKARAGAPDKRAGLR